MKKQEFITRLSEKTGFTKKVCTELLDATLEVIKEALAEGEEVNLSGFGKFSVTEKKARVGVNPQTLEKMDIPAIKSPKFKASSVLKELVR